MKNSSSLSSLSFLLVMTVSVASLAGLPSSVLSQTASVARPRPAVTIIPPSDTPVIGLDPKQTTASRSEYQNGKIFITRKSGGALSDVTVNYALTGSAVNGQDFALLSDSVVLPASQTRVALKIVPLSRGENGKVKVVVIAGQGYQIDAATKKVKIKIVD